MVGFYALWLKVKLEKCHISAIKEDSYTVLSELYIPWLRYGQVKLTHSRIQHNYLSDRLVLQVIPVSGMKAFM